MCIRDRVYSIAPISGVFIVLAQIINIYEDVTGEKVESCLLYTSRCV